MGQVAVPAPGAAEPWVMRQQLLTAKGPEGACWLCGPIGFEPAAEGDSRS